MSGVRQVVGTEAIRNLTPHEVNLLVDGASLSLAAEFPTPRVEFHTEADHDVVVEAVSVPVVRTGFSRIIDLPDPQLGVLLIVARTVAEHAVGRDDLVVPDDLIRDERGQVVGARRLARVTPRPAPR